MRILTITGILSLTFGLTFAAIPAQADDIDDLTDCVEASQKLQDISYKAFNLNKETQPLLEMATKKAKEYEDQVMSGAENKVLAAFDAAQTAAFRNWKNKDKELIKTQNKLRKLKKKMEKICSPL
ncbi:hypothetical protein [Candidatus Venteria ishoeyi]|uniref:Uncharacterized protein n=1 Tax=Candidatus Venteria ishoeyi TaxID=1899563 RepID=A0A1H6FJF4_9GAMM|nr:hypothetical protein [Candidatus Venteria ishoeyi]MDM8546797.1 hypothetical protein [Candidatus Venteria ishoeyi]SEH09165.1 Uncharacterised protein [Candidatus Venteria ishoeyi]SEH09294.1 Uncharacterised protein [Candidatus Venteria ishoeyi]